MSFLCPDVCFLPPPPQHKLDVEGRALPTAVRDSEERLSRDGLYLLENGLSLFLWVGAAAPPDLLRSVFDVSSFSEINPNMVSLPIRQELLPSLLARLIEVALRVVKLMPLSYPGEILAGLGVMSWTSLVLGRPRRLHDIVMFVSFLDEPADAGNPFLQKAT